MTGLLDVESGSEALGVLERFVDMWRKVVAEDGASGHGFAGIAPESKAENRASTEWLRNAFRSWIDLLAHQFEAAGLAAARARAFATATVAGMEGALLLCRAEGNSEPLDVVARELARLLRAEEEGRQARP